MDIHEYTNLVVGKNANHFLLNLPPRFGKSRIGIALVRKFLGDGRFLIFTGSQINNENWLDKVREYNPDLLDRMDIMCYQSAHKARKEYKVIICDEWELGLGPKTFEYVRNLGPAHWIAMSGSMNKDDENKFGVVTNYKYAKFKVDIGTAYSWGILPKVKVMKALIKIDDAKRLYVYEFGKDKSKKNLVIEYPELENYLFDKGLRKKNNLLVKCTMKEHLELCDRQYKFYADKFVETKDFRFNDLMKKEGNKRMGFMGMVKTRYVKHVIKEVYKNNEKSRILVFASDIKQAELINQDLSMHSLKPDSDELFDMFNRKEINTLVSVKMLNRGVDTYDCTHGLIVQVQGSNKETQQKAGRLYLSSSPKLILFCLDYAIDHTVVNNFLRIYPPDWIVHKKIEI